MLDIVEGVDIEIGGPIYDLVDKILHLVDKMMVLVDKICYLVDIMGSLVDKMVVLVDIIRFLVDKITILIKIVISADIFTVICGRIADIYF